ncbi:MAG: hypothetical protein JRN36_03350, partial [Nitrososphaerota archaeon]|nr:hypothetical protein [Nitrososphaerota archaeon]
MPVEYILLQTVAVPLVVAPVVLLLGRKLGRNVGWVAFASLLYTTLLLAYLASSLFNGGASVTESYAWVPVSGLVFGFLGDNLSIPVALTMNIIVTATSVYSMGYMKHRLEAMYGEERKGQYSLYFLNFMLLDAGLIGISLSTNLLELYMFLELMLIPSAFMMALFGYVNRERVAIMYFLWNHLGAFIFLAGIVLVYTATGSFQISALSTIPLGTVAYWAVGLILVGWLIKMAVFGVHMWLPYAHAEHPTSFAPIMAT